jgi:hypothetical protein
MVPACVPQSKPASHQRLRRLNPAEPFFVCRSSKRPPAEAASPAASLYCSGLVPSVPTMLFVFWLMALLP